MLDIDNDIVAPNTDIPEQKLLAAVVAVALRDSTQPPFTPANSTHLRMTEDAHSAMDFLLTDDCNGYLEWLDINTEQFRKRLLAMMEDKSARNSPFTPMQRRAFRMNRIIWQAARDAA